MDDLRDLRQMERLTHQFPTPDPDPFSKLFDPKNSETLRFSGAVIFFVYVIGNWIEGAMKSPNSLLKYSDFPGAC
jgi:hypothetical protein